MDAMAHPPPPPLAGGGGVVGTLGWPWTMVKQGPRDSDSEHELEMQLCYLSNNEVPASRSVMESGEKGMENAVASYTAEEKRGNEEIHVFFGLKHRRHHNFVRLWLLPAEGRRRVESRQMLSTGGFLASWDMAASWSVDRSVNQSMFL
ncbi:hypothetical protein GUJ93_ZPchr0003g16966 [Zizania palustris]|uniref:Uncharacterized protein n=1 Tax=Zizania palustris TaxID=103762 RepID=A0A8J5SC75_ZIZPA|nr:hypothetical protein GUJ93_ZPchr0003g16966 [Zizania palustris]